MSTIKVGPLSMRPRVRRTSGIDLTADILRARVRHVYQCPPRLVVSTVLRLASTLRGERPAM
jgi:hypothetical protein